jgi:hypothetical protein
VSNEKNQKSRQLNDQFKEIYDEVKPKLEQQYKDLCYNLEKFVFENGDINDPIVLFKKTEIEESCRASFDTFRGI